MKKAKKKVRRRAPRQKRQPAALGRPVQHVLRGALVLSTEREIPVTVTLVVPSGTTRAERRELENSAITLHDLSPGEAACVVECPHCEAPHALAPAASARGRIFRCWGCGGEYNLVPVWPLDH